MGGSSLAPEVITRTLGVAADRRSTPPTRRQIRAALGDRLERTVVVVSSKSGGTVETDSHRRAYWQAFLDAGLTEAEAGRHFVIVTDPGSPLETTGREMGAHGVPRRPRRRRPLLGADRLRRRAHGAGRCRRRRAARPGRGAAPAARPTTAGNPGLALGAALGAAATNGRDKVALVVRRHRHRRPRRLGRAAASPSRPARTASASCRSSSRRPTARRARLRRAHRDGRRRAAAGRRARRRRPPRRVRQRPARRAVPGLGVRDRDRRPGDRHRPVRPAQRDRVEEQHHPHPRRRACRTSRRRSPRARSRCTAAAGDDLARGARRAGRRHRPTQGYLAVLAYLDRVGDAGPRRRGRCWPPRPADRSPSAGGRATCTRPGSTTRAVRRSARSCRSPARSPTTCRCPASRTPSASCRRPRPPATGRRWPAGAARWSGCT